MNQTRRGVYAVANAVAVALMFVVSALSIFLAVVIMPRSIMVAALLSVGVAATVVGILRVHRVAVGVGMALQALAPAVGLALGASAEEFNPLVSALAAIGLFVIYALTLAHRVWPKP